MAASIHDFYAALPMCAICCTQMFSSTSLPYQLDCGHLFCETCLRETWSQQGYYCPFEGNLSVGASYSQDLLNRFTEVCANIAYLDVNSISGHCYFFRNMINYWNVPCRYFLLSQSCQAGNCPYAHNTEFWQQYDCPLWNNCARGQYCPYRHPLTVQTAQPSYFQTVADPSLYSAPAPAYVQTETSSNYNSGYNTGYGPSAQYQDLSTCSTTVDQLVFLKQGRVIIRSASLLKLLTNNNSELLNMLATNYSAGVQLSTSIVRYNSKVVWAHYKDDRRQYFNEHTNTLLESAYSRGSGEFKLYDTVVNMKLMVQVSPNHVIKVCRNVTISSSTDAGVLTINLPQQYYEAFFNEIQQYETFMPVESYSACSNLLEIANKYGLGVVQEKFYGTYTDLEMAAVELQQWYMTQEQPIESMQIPAGVDKNLLAAKAGELGVALYDTRMIGRSKDLMLFLAQIYQQYQTIPIPAGLNDAMVADLCNRFKLTKNNGSLVGDKADIARALEEIAEVSVPIQPGTDEAKIQEVIAKFNLRRDGNMLSGNRDQVKGALNVLQNLEVSVAYPKQILAPQVQGVCQRHNVRMEGDKIIGLQANVFGAMNELNGMLPEGNFQFHKPPQWYLTQAEELKVVDVPKTDPEYAKVATQFNATTKNPVTRIRRVQNKRLYTNFAFKHEGYSKIEGRAIEIKRLFHGTRANDPKVIYESDSGLDSRLGGGMWGNGSYYAFNSSYSTGYAHPAADGSKEMFLCEVIVGDFVQLAADGSLKKPPAKPNTQSSYHSVKGNTGGSDIWITYEPAMSYPHFIISYT